MVRKAAACDDHRQVKSDDRVAEDDWGEEGDGAAGSSHVKQTGRDRLQKRSFKNASGDISVSMFC